jgi:hypothetical protein
MIRMKPCILTAVCAVVLGLSASVASAQATRTWVSGVGDDVNPCSRTAPCKTFAGAISKTAAGGEISVLDPGSYGAITITKAITINGEGTLAGILHTVGTSGIIVNAGVNDRIVIRNVSIMGAGSGANGVRFLAGKQLTIEKVTITGFVTNGIDVARTTTGSLFVKDSVISNTTADTTTTGIRVTTTSGLALATLDNVRLEGLQIGVDAQANGRVNVSDSVISGNSSTGLLASNATAVINADSNQIGFNDFAGVNASVSGATIRLANNTIFNNSNGILIAVGATVASDGSNRVAGNGASATPNGAGTIVRQ